MKENDILVTVICTVYNHEKYLQKTIEGFLIQKCNFRFIVYIQDDCSTDNSKTIIQEYEKKYPNLIKGFYLKKNIFSQGKSPLFNLMNLADSKFIAICEGDDFWINEKKLQKQVDFLLKNKTYIASYHNVLVVDDDSKVYKDTNCIMPLYVQHDFTIKDLERKLVCCSQTASLVFKNFWRGWSKDNKKKFLECEANGDIKLNTVLLMLGKIKFMEEIMSCYRKSYINDSYTASNYKKNLCYSFMLSREAIEKMIFDIYKYKISFNIEKYISTAIKIFLRKPTIENLKILKKCLKKVGLFNYIFLTLSSIFNKHDSNYWPRLNHKIIEEQINGKNIF